MRCEQCDNVIPEGSRSKRFCAKKCYGEFRENEARMRRNSKPVVEDEITRLMRMFGSR